MKKVYCAVCGQEISEDEKAVLIFDQTTDEATLAVCERCCGKARPISKEEREELTKYQDDEEEEVEVELCVAQRIETADDLGDYYAYIESEIENPVYSFPESEQDRIDDLMDDLNYVPGYYRTENVYRILGLPTHVELDVDSCLADNIEDREYVEECINNYLSNTYGYCTLGWQYELGGDGKLYITDIDWDLAIN